jgi:hypothetical protein
MTSTARFIALSLIATGSFAQHSGGFRGGFAGPPGAALGAPPPVAGFGRVPPGYGGTGVFPGSHRGPVIRSAFGPGAFGHRFGYGNGFGYGYFAPYLPLFGYDQSLGGYPEETPGAGNVFIFSPNADTGAGPPPAPPHPASAVIHEYNVNPEVAAAAGAPGAFTIALKDGSIRSAVAFWVQQGKVHYIDPQDRQQVLSSDLIDRETTERLNRQKNLAMQLPPI